MVNKHKLNRNPANVNVMYPTSGASKQMIDSPNPNPINPANYHYTEVAGCAKHRNHNQKKVNNKKSPVN